MPPRTRNRNNYHMHIAGTEFLLQPEKLTTSRHLSSQFLSMLRETKRSIQCPICLWEPEGVMGARHVACHLTHPVAAPVSHLGAQRPRHEEDAHVGEQQLHLPLDRHSSHSADEDGRMKIVKVNLQDL